MRWVIYLNLAIDKFKCYSTCAYTTLAKVWSVFST